MNLFYLQAFITGCIPGYLTASIHLYFHKWGNHPDTGLAIWGYHSVFWGCLIEGGLLMYILLG